MEEDAHCPVVDFEGVGLAHAHFRGHVFAGSAEGVAVCVVIGDFTETKVCEEEMAFRVEEAIFGFEVAVDDALFVEGGEGEEDFCDVERGDVFGKHLFGVEMVE